VIVEPDRFRGIPTRAQVLVELLEDLGESGGLDLLADSRIPDDVFDHGHSFLGHQAE
jgi:hypothetical protein